MSERNSVLRRASISQYHHTMPARAVVILGLSTHLDEATGLTDTPILLMISGLE